MIDSSKAVERLNNEIDENNNDYFIQAIGEYLISECNKENNNDIVNAILKPKKSLKNCADYIFNYAKKNSNNNRYVLKDSAVYEIAINFYMDDNISEEEIKNDHRGQVACDNNNAAKFIIVKNVPKSEEQEELDW